MNPFVHPADTSPGASAKDRYLVYAVLGDSTAPGWETLPWKCRELTVVPFEELRIVVRVIPAIIPAVIPTVRPESPPGDDDRVDQLQEFSDVLCELHRLGDILPFRYGTVVAIDALPKFFAPQKEALLHSLEQVRGCVEINLRWAVPEASLFPSSNAQVETPKEPETGFSYLKGKWKSRQRDQQVEALLVNTGESIRTSVGTECVAFKTSIRTLRTVGAEGAPETTYSIARLDLLIRRNAYPQVLQTVATIPFCETSPTLISGPWPPFSFVHGSGTNANEKPLSDPERRPQPALEATA